MMVSERVKKLVDAKIAGKKVMVFSKSWCPYCTKAKKVLNSHVGKDLQAADYEVMEIDKDSDESEIQAYMMTLTKAKSVPRVFIKGKCIGGGDETAALEKSGQLAKLLA